MNDHDAFLQLLAEHESQIFGFLFALVCHRQDAEDLMQQVVITMWNNFGGFEKGSNFVAWGCRIAKNQALNHFQKKKRRRVFSNAVMELLEQSQASQPSEIRHARRQALAHCFESLAKKDQELIDRCYLRSSDTMQVVAKELGRPAAGVYNSVSRIRKALYHCIQTKLAQEGLA